MKLSMLSSIHCKWSFYYVLDEILVSGWLIEISRRRRPIIINLVVLNQVTEVGHCSHKIICFN